MTSTECKERIAFLFEAYDRKKKRITERYERSWNNAITASEILALNEWHERELEELARWWKKSLTRLSEDMKRGGEQE